MTDSTGCTVTMCRGCCCGSTDKHPGVDHERQVDRLRQTLRSGSSAGHRVRVSDCLDVCAQSNVLVVHPAPAARVAGARPVWFGLVLDDTVLDDIATWITDGGPGRAALSSALQLSVIDRP